MKPKLTAIILTLNESLHIARCIKSLLPCCDNIYIVDSGSTDDTVHIAKNLGAQVYVNEWVNYATQLNWALNNTPIDSEWVMRIDADEYLTPELQHDIAAQIPAAPATVSGYHMNRRVHFMGKWIKYGGYYPIKLLRIWRHSAGRCEERWMDEHIILEHGHSKELVGDIVDDNLNNIGWWTDKHNRYATREAVDLLNIKHQLLKTSEAVDSGQAGTKRWLKENAYSRLPIGVRALIYFLYRYFFRLGFLDGKKGFIFHFLQAMWYRFLVDAKIFEIETKAKNTQSDIKSVLLTEYGIRLD